MFEKSIKKKETPTEIYQNSCLHYCKEKYVGNELRNVYLIDRRFILDETLLKDVLYNEDCLLSEYQDKYFLIFEISKDCVKPGFSNILFLKLIANKALLSIYDFIIEYKA